MDTWMWTKRSKGQFTTPGAHDHFPPDLGLEPKHLAIFAELDFNTRSAVFEVTHSLVSNREGATRLALDGVDMELESVESPNRELSWDYDGRQLVVAFKEGLGRGESCQLRIKYRVTEPVAGLYFWPAEGSAKLAFTDNETERARYWLLTIDAPSVRPSLEFQLRSAAGLTALANGKAGDLAVHGEGSQTQAWRLDQPCPSYLTNFVVGELVRYDDAPHGAIPIAYFGRLGTDPAALQRSFGRTKEMLQWLEQRLGLPFPYPKYFQYAAPEIGGAMENISLVSWDELFVLDEQAKAEMGWLVDQVNIHEMAHSYFGDYIVCREYAHAWLKESFAVYIESCWLEEKVSQDEAAYDLYCNLKAYLTEADERYKRPLVTRKFESTWQLFDRHLYPGGAVRLHMLRRHMGEQAFWSGMTRYVNDFANKVVETEDFRRVMEEVSGLSLVQFFEEWIYAPGYPDLVVDFNYDPETGEGHFKVKQKQAEGEDAEEPTFHLDLELAWGSNDELQVEKVAMHAVSQSYRFPMARAPQVVRVDPHGSTVHKLSFNPGIDRLIAQLDAPDVLGRIQAGHQLMAKESARGVEAIGERLRREPFWGVRVELCEALAKGTSAGALSILIARLEVEQEALVLFPLAKALVGKQSKALKEALLQRLSAQDLGYRARGELYAALGAQRAAAPLDYLQQALRVEAHDFALMGICRGLAASRQEGAFALLERCLFDASRSPRVRGAAGQGLGELAGYLGKAIQEAAVDTLERGLRLPDRTVRAGLAVGLSKLGGGRAIGLLEGYRAPLAKQEQVGVDRLIQAARGSEAAKVKAMEEELERLRSQLSSLSERLTRLEG